MNRLAGRTTEEVIEYLEEKELKANTQMLEIVGKLGTEGFVPFLLRNYMTKTLAIISIDT